MENTHTPESLATMQTPAAAAVPAEAQRRGRGKICGVKSVKPILHSLQACSRDYQHSLYQNKDLSIEDAVAVAQSLWLWQRVKRWWVEANQNQPPHPVQASLLTRCNHFTATTSPSATSSLQPPHPVQTLRCNLLTQCKPASSTGTTSLLQPPHRNHFIATTSLQPPHPVQLPHLVQANLPTWCKPVPHTAPIHKSQFTASSLEGESYQELSHTHTDTHMHTHTHVPPPFHLN